MVSQLLNQTLKGLGKPVYRLVRNLKDPKNKTSPETYFTFQTLLSQPSGYADDDNTIIIHTFRVNLFTKFDFTAILSSTLTALKQAGFTISTVDGELYENDTGYYHIPMTIKMMEE